jgi:phenylalanyl-tRNA synthetase beta subunit
MGGENSEILDDTTTVVFESANFNGTSIRQTALALGMRTESSGKFEKNLDPMMTVPAVQRACELVELLQCGDVMDGIIDIINYVPETKQLPLEPEKINKLLGTNISKQDMIHYLQQTGFPYMVVLTKADKLNKTEYQKQMDYFNDLQRLERIPLVIPFSAVSGAGTPEILAAIEAACSDEE